MEVSPDLLARYAKDEAVHLVQEIHHHQHQEAIEGAGSCMADQSNEGVQTKCHLEEGGGREEKRRRGK